MDKRLVPLIAAVLALGALWLGACGASRPEAPASGTPASTTSSPSAAGDADLRVKQGVHAILIGLQSWAVSQHTAHYPRRADQATLGEALTGAGEQWPVNPLTGAAMEPGDQPGDYLYDLAKDKKSCTVTAFLSDGSAYSPQVLHCD